MIFLTTPTVSSEFRWVYISFWNQNTHRFPNKVYRFNLFRHSKKLTVVNEHVFLEKAYHQLILYIWFDGKIYINFLVNRDIRFVFRSDWLRRAKHLWSRECDGTASAVVITRERIRFLWRNFDYGLHMTRLVSTYSLYLNVSDFHVFLWFIPFFGFRVFFTKDSGCYWIVRQLFLKRSPSFLFGDTMVGM